MSFVRHSSRGPVAVVATLIPTIALVWGCSGGGPGDPTGSAGPAATAGSPSAPDDAAMIERTIVHLAPDGTTTMKTMIIPAAQSRAERAEREARRATGGSQVMSPELAVGAPSSGGGSSGGSSGGGGGSSGSTSVDDSCASADLALFSVNECNRGADHGAELCFYGAGTVNLHDYFFCPLPAGNCTKPWQKSPWSHHVLSYGPGSEAGYFFATHDGGVFTTKAFFPAAFPGQCIYSNGAAWEADGVTLTH
jgi:hypothetical protein